MVAIVSGNALGVSLSSWTTLGQQGQIGTPGLGQNGEQAFVNITTGNLVLQDRDDVFQAMGTEVVALRTYNSQGLLDDDNGDNWTSGVFKGGNIRFTGTSLSQSSTVYRTGTDGAEAAYNWDSSTSAYVTLKGSGAYDTIKYTSSPQGSYFTWTDGDTGATEKYTKNALGKYVLSTATDARGNSITYTYDSLGQIQKVQASTGDSFTFDYQGGTRLASVIYTSAAGANSTVARYDYNTDGKLKSTTVDLTPDDNSIADGNVYITRYWYDGAGNLSTVQQADGTSITFGYESDGGTGFRVSSVTDGVGRTTTFVYDKQNRRTTVIDAQQRQTVYAYDIGGRLTSVTAPAVAGATSQVTNFTYASGNGGVSSLLATVTDPLGRQVAMTYDTKGNQTLQRDAAGNTITRTFDSYNQVTTEAVYLVPDPDGSGAGQPSQPLVTRYVYDGTSKRLLRFILSAEGRVTEYRYDALGERVAMLQYTQDKYDVSSLAATAVPTAATVQTWVSGRGGQAMRTDYGYDYRGQLQTATQWAQVDSSGTGVNDGKQSVTTYVRDYEGKLRQTISGTGATTSYTYDGLGRLFTATNAQNELTTYTYDAANNAIRVKQANGLVTSRAYDAAGQLISVAQSSTSVSDLGTTRYFYDALGHLAMSQDPTNVRTWSLYDEAGRKVADIDGDGSLTEYRYNAANLLTHTIAYATRVSTAALLNASNQPTNPTLASIRPVSTSDDRHTWRVYDGASRLVGEVDGMGEVTITTYDGAGRKTSVKAYATRLVTSGLGDAPTLAAVTPANAADDRMVRSYYDADGNLRGELDGEGYLTEYLYDSAGRLCCKKRYTTPTAHAATFSNMIPVAAATDQVTTYLYNAKGQVAGEIDAESYFTEKVYDKNGNLAQSIRYATKVTAAYTIASTVDNVRPTSSALDQSTSWQYDGLNRVTQQTDWQGTVTQFTYDNAGNLVKTVKALGQPEARTLQARYDIQGRLVGELTAEGSAQLTGNETPAQIDAIWAQWGLTHTYDTAGRRTSTTDQYGNKTLFFYNADNQLTHTVNALGEVIENEYNGLGQRTAVIRYGARIGMAGLTGANAGGRVNTALTSAIDLVKTGAPNSKTSYTYDTAGRVKTTTDALGYLTTLWYTAFGEENARSQALGTQSYDESRTYDRRGLVLFLSRSGGGGSLKTYTSYDAFGRVLSTVDGNGNERDFTWDRLGRQVTSSDQLGAVFTTGYDAFSRVATQKDALGNITQYTYNNAQRSVTITTPEGIVTTTVSTRFGQTLSVTDGRGNTTSYDYDRDGNLKTTTRADLSTVKTNYDRADRIADTTDAAGNKVAFSYDAASRVFTRTVDPAGLNLVTTYGWDAKGQQITTTSPNGVVTKFDYDLKGQLSKQTVDPSGLNLVTTYTYDGASNVLTVTTPAGNLTQYTYDALGRRTKEQVDPSGLNLTRTWAYDDAGNVANSRDANGQLTRYAYDNDNRLVYTVDPNGAIQENGYDLNGRLTRVKRYATRIDASSLAAMDQYPRISQVQPYITISAQDITDYRVFDRDGRLTATVDGTGAVVKYTYDANGNVIDRRAYAAKLSGWTPGTVPNPTSDDTQDQRIRTVYDKLNRAIYTVDGTGAVIATQYDGNGNVVQRKAYAQQIPAGTAATESAISQAVNQVADAGRDMLLRQVYDKAGRLAYSVDGVGAVTRRDYDGDGNLRQLTQYATPIAAGADPASVIASASDRTTTYTWDKAGRNTYVTDALGGIVKNDYDANGRLTLRRAYAGASLDDANDRIDRFTYDTAGRLAYTVDAAGAATLTEYDGVGRVVRTTAFAKPLTQANLLALPTTGRASDVAALVTRNAGQDRTTQQVFDPAGELVYTIDAAGYVRENQYDGLGRVKKTILYSVAPSLGAQPTVDTVRAALVGDPATRTDSYTYDAAGRLLSSTDSLNNIEFYTYDAVGNKKTFKNKKGDVWTYDYDAAGHMVRETSPSVKLTSVVPVDGALVAQGATPVDAQIVTLLVYDALGNLTSRTEAAGLSGQQRTTSYHYDALGRQVMTLYPSVDVYDPTNDLLTTTGLAPRSETPKPLSTSTVYDTLGNAIAGQDLAGNWSYKLYDRLGHVRYEVDAMGYVAGSTRNAFGEVTDLARYANPVTVTPPGPQGFTQQDVQALAVLLGSNPARHLQTQYDQRGRAATVTEPAVYTYTTDAAANSGAPSLTSRVTTNTYNAFGELVRAVVGSGSRAATTDHFYDRRGQEVGTVDAMGYLTVQAYDEAGLLKSRIEYATSVGAGDWGSQPVQADAPTAPATSDADRETTYLYDALGRKTSETRVGVQAAGPATRVPVADGSLTVTSTAQRPSMVFDNPGANGIASVAFYGGADGTGVLRWAQPAPGIQSVLRWRRLPLPGEQPQAWQSGSDLIVDDAGGMQHFAFDADLPAGSYQVEVTYQQPGDVVVARVTGTLNAPGPLVAASVSGMPADMRVVDRVVTGMGSVKILQWTAPASGQIATLQFQPPGGNGDWLSATIVSDGGVQYVVLPPGLPAGAYRVRLDFYTVAANPVNATTTYDYDAVGNLVHTLDAKGGDTYSYYDALGRVTAVVTPTVAGVGGTLTPLTEYYRDAFGNAVGTVQRARGAATANMTGWMSAGGDAADHIQGFAYDRFGHLVQSTDAGRVNHYYSYNERGDLAKSWQAVTDPYSMAVSTIWQQLQYDKLGRLVSTKQPGPTQLDGSIGITDSTQVYNAYGEVVEKRVNGAVTEFFEYDAAGRVWRTNAGDGNVRVMLYDALGNATLELRSDGSGNGSGSNIDLKSTAFTGADVALQYAANLRQTLTMYDKLGHAIRQVLPQKLEGTTGVDLLQTTPLMAVTQVGTLGADPDRVMFRNDHSQYWLTPNKVALSWASLADFGPGEIKVELDYSTRHVAGEITWDNPVSGNTEIYPYDLPAANRTLTRVLTAEQGAMGSTLSWSDDRQYGGIDKITGLRVSKKGLDGQWHLVLEQGAASKPVNLVLVARPADMGAITTDTSGGSTLAAPVVEVKLQARLAGSGNGWSDMPSLVDFGKKLMFNAAGLPDGTYEYQVLTRRAGDSAYAVTSTGSVTMAGTVVAPIETPVLIGAKGAGVYYWQTPAIADAVQTFHYRPTGSSGAWQTLPVSSLDGTYSGVNASLLPSGTYDYELSYSHGSATTPFARTTGTLTTTAASGVPSIDGFYFKGNDDGTSLMRWLCPPEASAVMTYRRMDSSDPAVPVPWEIKRDGAYLTTTTPNTLAPGQYKIDLTLKVGTSVVAHSSAILTIAIGATQAPVCTPVAPKIEYKPAYTTPAEGTPPVDQLQFTPFDNGDWSVSWPAVAGLRSEFWMRAHGTGTWELKNSKLVLANGVESVTILDADAAPGQWDVEVRQFDSSNTRVRLSAQLVTTYVDGTVAPSLKDTTPYTAAQNYPVIKASWDAYADGTWSISWGKNADPTVSPVMLWRPAGTGTTWKVDDPSWRGGNVVVNGTTCTVSGDSSNPGSGDYDVAVFEVKGGVVVAQNLRTITLKAGTYAAATYADTTPVYVAGSKWTVPTYAPNVAGLAWSEPTLSWPQPSSGTTIWVNYRQSGTGQWRTADPATYQSAGGSQSCTLSSSLGFTDGTWDIQVTQIRSGAVVGLRTGTVNVTGGATSFGMASTFPGVAGFQVANPDKAGSTVSWAQPPAGYTAVMSYQSVSPAGAWTLIAASSDGTRQTVNIPAGWNPGDYNIKVELTDPTGALIQTSTGRFTLAPLGGTNSFAETTPGNTVTSSAPSSGVPKLSASFSSDQTGTWTLQWGKPGTGTPTVRYRLKNSGAGWTNVTSRVSDGFSTASVTFLKTELSAGTYEFDVFYGPELRTWQYTCDVNVNSTPGSRPTFVDRTPTYVPPSGPVLIPVAYTMASATVWQLTWEQLPAGQTMEFKATTPTGVVIDYTNAVLVYPDGRCYLQGPVNMDAGAYQLSLKYSQNGVVVKQATGTFTFAQNDTKADSSPVDTGYKPPVYHPQDGVPPVDGVHFEGRTDGSWTMSWTHVTTGPAVKFRFRPQGATEWLYPKTLPDTSNGVDSYTIHAWDIPEGGTWDVELYSEDANQNLLSQSKGSLVMAKMGTVAPGLVGDPSSGYTPASYYVSQQPGKASQTYVPTGSQTLVPGFAVQPTGDGGTRFSWTTSATAADSFSYRRVGNGVPGQWETPTPGSITENGTAKSVVYVGAGFPAGEYEMQLTRTENGSSVTLTGQLFVVAAAPAGPAGPVLTQAGASNTAAPSLQAVVNRTYDRWNNVLSVSDARNAAWVTRYAYNANNQLVQQWQPDGSGSADASETKILYDVLGRQVAVIDANGNLNRQEWDAAGNLLTELHADGGEVSYRYDVFGNKVQMVAKANANTPYTTTYAYDALNRLKTTTYTAVDASRYDVDGSGNYVLANDNPSQQALVETNTWDEAGRQTSHTGTGGELTEYRYDLRGNVIANRQASVLTQMAYDAQGRMTEQRDGSGYTAKWTYDYFGKLDEHWDIGGAKYSYSYDNARQLVAQSNTRARTGDQPWQVVSLTYKYDRAGNLVEINDASTNTIQKFAYDLGGRRIRETTTQGDTINGVPMQVTHRDNYLAYDALGRLALVEDGRASVQMWYDKVGNRSRIKTHVITTQADTGAVTQVEGANDSDNYFRYDAMNRQTVANARADGTLGEDGHRLTYDWLGNKTSDSWQGKVITVKPGTTYTMQRWGYNDVYNETTVIPTTYQAQLGETTESYSYDALGRLTKIQRDGTAVEQRQYDKAGRLTQSGPGALSSDYLAALYGTYEGSNQPLPGNGTELKKNAYDANGRLVRQLVEDGSGKKLYELDYRKSTAAPQGEANYDAAGNLQGYVLKDIQGNYSRSYTNHYLRMEGYRNDRISVSRGSDTSASWTKFDGNGYVVNTADTGLTGSERFFVNDEGGRAVSVRQGNHIQHQLIVNGEVLGRYGEVVDETKPKSAAAPSFKTVADFDFGFASTAGNTPQMADRTHAVSAGDTLQSIAKSYYGDERLWYRIADANGVSGNSELQAGQILKVPALEASGNAAGTFRPYDPSKVQGDNTPYMPAPKPKKKSFLGQLLAVVVIAIVAIYTAGALSGVVTSTFGETLAAGASALSGGGAVVAGQTVAAASFGTAAVAGAAGSIAGQLVSIAAGDQSGFNWRQVALSALSSGIGASLPSGFASELGSTGRAVARAAVGNALTQGIGVVTGLQSKFDWKGVAASAVGTGVGQEVGGALGLNDPGLASRPFGEQFGARLVTGFAAGAAAAVARGGKVAVQQVAVDAMGNVLGDSFVDAMQPKDPLGAYINAQLAAQNRRDMYGLAGLGARLGAPRPDIAGQWDTRVDQGIQYTASQSPDGPSQPEAVLLTQARPSMGDIVVAASQEGVARRDAFYRPGVDSVDMTPVFKIYGAGSVHESIAEEAARRAGLPFDQRLRDGVRWPDVPSDKPNETYYGGLVLDMNKPGTLTYESHYGSRQYWHSMVPSDGRYTNQQVADKIVDQAKAWYQQAISEDNVFHVGKLLHMVQDSYSQSHVVRNTLGDVVMFQSYQEQDSHAHGTADEIPKGGTWLDVKGAEPATVVSTAVLSMYKERSGVDVLEKYLRENVYHFANGLIPKAPAGGSAPQYQKPLSGKSI